MARQKLTEAVKLLLTLLFFSSTLAYEEFVGLQNVPASRVVAVEGETVILPCNVSAASHADRAKLLLFFRDGVQTPVFSLDGREAESIEFGTIYAQPNLLGRKARFISRNDQHGLLVSKIGMKDSGTYRCRVDFKRSPSRDTVVHLNVISPPEHLIITDGAKIVSGVIGPYKLGEQIELSCQVSQGEPTPQVMWYNNGKLLDPMAEIATPEITLNKLTLPPLTLEDVGRELTCRANNSDLVKPIESTVTLAIITAPREISLWLHSDTGDFNTIYPEHITERLTIKAGEQHSFKCAVKGSNPSAIFTWTLKNSKNESLQQSHKYLKEKTDRSVGDLESTFQLIPGSEHQDSVIKCSAYNPEFPDVIVDTEIQINVLHPPKVRIESEVYEKEGDKKYKNFISLECHVTASPQVTQLKWYQNSRLLKFENLAEKGQYETKLINDIYEESDEEDHYVIYKDFYTDQKKQAMITRKELREMKSLATIEEQTFFLRIRYRENSNGYYTCEATNELGTTVSESTEVRIKKVPRCITRKNTPNDYKIQLKEEVRLTCPLESHPKLDAVKWSFRSKTGETVVLQQSLPFDQFKYVPRTIDEFGTLLCWGRNSVGEMTEPCEINITPSGLPEPVSNCNILTTPSVSQKTSFMSVSCEAGWDGGAQQLFSMRLFILYENSRILMDTVVDKPLPFFGIPELKAGRYMFEIKSSNRNGESSTIKIKYTMDRRTPKVNSVRESELEGGFFSWFFIVAAVLALFFFIVCILVVYKCVKSCRKAANIKAKKSEFLDPFLAYESDEQQGAKLSNIYIADRRAKMGNEYTKPQQSKVVSSSPSSDSDATQQMDTSDSGCDVRISSPCLWPSNSNDSVYDSYQKNSGPYHIDNLYPPPTFYQTSDTAPMHIYSATAPGNETLSTRTGGSTPLQNDSLLDDEKAQAQSAFKESSM